MLFIQVIVVVGMIASTTSLGSATPTSFRGIGVSLSNKGKVVIKINVIGIVFGGAGKFGLMNREGSTKLNKGRKRQTRWISLLLCFHKRRGDYSKFG